MRYRLQRHDGTDCSATMVPITVLRMVPIQRYRQQNKEMCFLTHKAVGWECPVYCFFFYGIWFFFEGMIWFYYR